MSESYISFTAPMAQDVFEDRKNITRRLGGLEDINLEPDAWKLDRFIDGNVAVFQRWREHPTEEGLGWWQTKVITCPKGGPGDSLWVKEPWTPVTYRSSIDGEDCEVHGIKFADDVVFETSALLAWLDGERKHHQKTGWLGKKRSSRFMPRWASRLTLEIVSVRVERLKDITETDIEAEGIPMLEICSAPCCRCSHKHECSQFVAWIELWDSINGKKHPWSSNPWVWVIGFKKVSK